MLSLKDILFLNVLLAIFLSGVIFIKRKLIGGQSFLLLSSVLLICYVVDLLYTYRVFTEAKMVLITLYLGNTVAATSLLFFALQYANQRVWLQFPRWTLFFVEPMISLLTMIGLSAETKIQGNLSPYPPPLFWVWDYFHKFYIVLILFLAIVIVAPRVSLGIGALRRTSIMVLGASFIPVIPLALGFGITLEPFPLQMFAFSLSGIVIGLALFHANAIDLMPVSRHHIVENMREGWILLDSQNRLIDANASAEKMLDISRAQIYGADAKTIFSPWPNIIRTLETGQELETKSSFTVHGEIFYLHVRVLHIKDPAGLTTGRLILLRDYTERRKAEVARQQARDEMFSLLHSISGAASHSENMNDFITASMYQLAYSFASQMTAVFLNDREAKDDRFLLVAHHGIMAKHVESLAFLDQRYELVSQVLESQKSLLINDAQTDARIPAFLRNAFVGSLLVVPIIAEDEFVGLILLTRENKTYSNDEIVRLEIAAEQVGSFVRSDRRRHIASTLAERQRLIRDLHDSVTQRLYALVMTTEAAHLGLKSGTLLQPGEVITQLGFHARQALKEMRLFLHKLQPIDLERDGLAVVLMRRLEAVEGRAGLEKEVDINENIALGPEEELALFFIAQEALNNILKYANASAIKVKLKKAKVNVRLEISDNGCGFDVRKVNQFGLGLKNMRTRAKQIGAKMKVSSAPGQGTKITVLLRHKKPQDTVEGK